MIPQRRRNRSEIGSGIFPFTKVSLHRRRRQAGGACGELLVACATGRWEYTYIAKQEERAEPIDTATAATPTVRTQHDQGNGARSLATNKIMGKAMVSTGRRREDRVQGKRYTRRRSGAWRHYMVCKSRPRYTSSIAICVTCFPLAVYTHPWKATRATVRITCAMARTLFSRSFMKKVGASLK